MEQVPETAAADHGVVVGNEDAGGNGNGNVRLPLLLAYQHPDVGAGLHRLDGELRHDEWRQLVLPRRAGRATSCR